MATIRVTNSTSGKVSSSARVPGYEASRQTGVCLRQPPAHNVLRGARLHGDTSALRQQISSKCTAGATRSETTMIGTGKFVVGGNWKCNGTTDSITQLITDLNAGSITADVEVVCAPPSVYIPKVQSELGAPFEACAQNCWIGEGGAYTGEISADMLVDLGVKYVILGHSERRQLCGESDEVVGQKTHYALEKGLKVIACIGETLEEREAGNTLDVCYRQLAAIDHEIKIKDWADVIIAYEPVWAIGTGKVATPDQAQEVHAGIRSWLSKNVSPDVALQTRIQYGGSVNAGNCEELAKMEDIDGFLVGGASLKGADFVTICNAAQYSS
mmetsp:Transcript_40463/g.49074  ORF Transcript_40463/g.49074 Transcript_40463/m.49074 type:complete len:328 (-) Transcript_40463:232-1215(-)|eukprot:CAMPEP_0197844176 /NCGR_PEP_ID=MMETSP1438-20131217/1160_1 /TAXON_ID=1461541 /ORGANISM="Pterosperma sp., Strain CCMP1384" /LENGTH=327 /DNA_ID=CAMNT_0043454821 /DNA_START=84 /DNA_END=1067 /DNA_ORIENTATION=+